MREPEFLEDVTLACEGVDGLVARLEQRGATAGTDGWSVSIEIAGERVGAASLARRGREGSGVLALESLRVDRPGQGIGTAFLRAVRDFVAADPRFETLAIERVTSRRALALLERELGELRERPYGVAPEHLPLDSPAVDGRVPRDAPAAFREVSTADLRARMAPAPSP